MTITPMTDAELAADIATEAGKLLLAVQICGLSGKALCNAGDLQANDLILARLRAERPGDAILSEESADDLDRLNHRRVWIVDPLDGTREFVKRNGEFSVNLALVEDGVAIFGLVLAPVGGALWHGQRGGAAYRRDGDAEDRKSVV